MAPSDSAPRERPDGSVEILAGDERQDLQALVREAEEEPVAEAHALAQ